MLRVGLFLLTNMAVLVVASITLNILHSQGIITGQTTSLLVFCAIFGMGGSVVSLLISKWMAKRASGTRIIDQPRTAEERWLVETVAELAQKAGIGMPEVGHFPGPAVQCIRHRLEQEQRPGGGQRRFAATL